MLTPSSLGKAWALLSARTPMCLLRSIRIATQAYLNSQAKAKGRKKKPNSEKGRNQDPRFRRPRRAHGTSQTQARRRRRTRRRAGKNSMGAPLEKIGEEGTKLPQGGAKPRNHLNLLFAAENLSVVCANLSWANINISEKQGKRKGKNTSVGLSVVVVK